MFSFKEYMSPQPSFKEILIAADDAMSKGKYHHAWELVNKARPRSEDEASEKAMYLDKLGELFDSMKKPL